ncbi:hypothetical protein J3459_018571 [Metarhizium acridum]|nr:hypothetical protein J3459_018571 [Metarhizium acridum]
MLHTLTVISLAASAVASAAAALRPWKAAGPDDSRSPCPMVNTLANHGYLPHNGRNLSVKHFGDAVVEALNTVPAYGTRPASVFLKAGAKTPLTSRTSTRRGSCSTSAPCLAMT